MKRFALAFPDMLEWVTSILGFGFIAYCMFSKTLKYTFKNANELETMELNVNSVVFFTDGLPLNPHT